MDRRQLHCQDHHDWPVPEQLLFTEVKHGPKEQSQICKGCFETHSKIIQQNSCSSEVNF